MMSAGVAATLLKGWQGKGDFCVDVGLIEGSSANSSCETSYYDRKMLEEQEVKCGSECVTEEDSTSSPAGNERAVTLNSSGLERMGSGISVLSADSCNIDNKNNVADDLCKHRLSTVEAGKLLSSKYKGVVPQPNGRWGAQIYEKHQRVWLGTFNKEEEAAAAYDRAALKFRGREAITNFSPLDDAHPEAVFLRRHGKAEIVDMLRKHTYEKELDQFIRNCNAEAAKSSNPGDRKVAGSNPAAAKTKAFPREHLFDKTVTPSDVGKLNRLVIPKQHAEKHFPLEVASGGSGLLLNFEDAAAKTWRFRYSYWNSSQSYVLTKGWSRFVKDKDLQAGDIVTFERSTGGAGQLYVSFRRRPCKLLLSEPPKPAPSGGLGLLPLPRESLNFLGQQPVAGYCRWTPVFYSPPPVEQPSVRHGSIPLAAARNYVVPRPSPSMKLASDDRNSRNLPIENSSSRIMVFGVNLSQPSHTLNLFPSTIAEEEEGCDGLQQSRKRKAAEPSRLYCVKKEFN